MTQVNVGYTHSSQHRSKCSNKLDIVLSYRQHCLLHVGQLIKLSVSQAIVS